MLGCAHIYSAAVIAFKSIVISQCCVLFVVACLHFASKDLCANHVPYVLELRNVMDQKSVGKHTVCLVYPQLQQSYFCREVFLTCTT